MRKADKVKSRSLFPECKKKKQNGVLTVWYMYHNCSFDMTIVPHPLNKLNGQSVATHGILFYFGNSFPSSLGNSLASIGKTHVCDEICITSVKQNTNCLQQKMSNEF